MDALTRLLNRLSNDKFKYKYIKQLLISKDYPRKRMETMNSKIVHWMDNKADCNTEKERQFCKEMCEMYERRYRWYINNWKNA